MSYRRSDALDVRTDAAILANRRPHPDHLANEDEQKFRHDESKQYQPSYLMSFTKGLPHDDTTGLISNPDDFQLFVRAIDSGDFRDFRDTPLGHPNNCLGNQCNPADFGWRSDKALTSGENGGPVNVRAWESQSAGNAFELEGPDAQAVTMPPAPPLGSEELTAEMGEVYVQALLRDLPLAALSAGVSPSLQIAHDAFATNDADLKAASEEITNLNTLSWFSNAPLKLSLAEAARRRTQNQTPSNAFRGITFGDDIGPYLSQFLLIGNTGINGNDPERSLADGQITYGAISIDQKVRKATEGLNYMTTWDEWLDVQQGADVRGLESYDNTQSRRFIHTARDLATYVHYDALYEAYLNACLIMLGMGIPFDPGIPFRAPDNRDHQQGFAHFGGPHILSLVTEVATRALKAVRFQKFNVHRRCRPEVLAARLHKTDALQQMAPELVQMRDHLDNTLSNISTLNNTQNGTAGGGNNYLLPMAFSEGSPMHPAYGAGHATVAGACVTILKAFFDHRHPLNIVSDPANASIRPEVISLLQQTSGNPSFNKGDFSPSQLAYVSTNNGNDLTLVPVFNQFRQLANLTVEGELNKLASNISIGRNWAGVHYFTDYYESILMGEKIALGILEEQKLTYQENFSMTVPLFDGTTRRI